MAEATALSLWAVERIRAANRLQPRRLRSFKLDRDPEFAKLSDIGDTCLTRSIEIAQKDPWVIT